MKICKDCGRKFKTLRFHHDPPRSRRFMEKGTQYFIDKDSKKKVVLSNQKNRKLCRDCHKEADRSWGCRMPNILIK